MIVKASKKEEVAVACKKIKSKALMKSPLTVFSRNIIALELWLNDRKLLF